ncbi:MAG: Stp1/IreP family PP2C-type Ser/Thr phosphatase [Polyangiaceae bacterium]
MTDPSTSNGPTEGEASPQGHTGRGSVSLRLFARTDVGQIREHNEDNFLVADLTRKSRGLLESNRSGPVGAHGSLFAVCDGMGGAAAGEVASQLAVDIIYERMVEGLVDGVPCERDDLARRLVRAVESAGLRIFQEAKMDRTRRGMGTTVTAAALVDDHLFLAQVGDSRGYILRGETMVQVTRDQSLVNQLIEAGQLTEEEAETFEHNNIILQALGTSDTVQVDLTYVHLRKGDVLLLCSDGLSGMVRFEELKEVLRGSNDTVEICKTLTDRANQAGGHDNITVVVVQFDGEGLKPVDASDEALKYKKYTLPEPPELTEPTRRHSLHGALLGGPGPASGGVPSAGADGAPRSAADAAGVGPASGWHEHGPHSNRAAHSAGEHEDRIDIPGTHVPTWVFAMLVAGVLTLLGVTAFLVLH